MPKWEPNNHHAEIECGEKKDEARYVVRRAMQQKAVPNLGAVMYRENEDSEDLNGSHNEETHQTDRIR